MQSEAETFYSQWPEKMGEVKEQAPDVARAFGSLFQSLMKPGALSVREKELIALGIGLAVRCVPCINTHVEKSLRAGATREEILEAAGVAVLMRGGPTYTTLPKVIEALDAIQGQEQLVAPANLNTEGGADPQGVHMAIAGRTQP